MTAIWEKCLYGYMKNLSATFMRLYWKLTKRQLSNNFLEYSDMEFNAYS